MLRLNLGKCKTKLFAALCASNVGNVDSLACKEILNVCTELIIGNLADEANLLAQACKAYSDVGRRTADIFLVVFALIKCVVVVRRVEVDCNSADRDEVKLSRLIKINVFHTETSDIFNK